MYLIWDTNALIDHHKTLQTFSEDVERLGIELKNIIPSVVLSELDGCAQSALRRVLAANAQPLTPHLAA